MVLNVVTLKTDVCGIDITIPNLSDSFITTCHSCSTISLIVFPCQNQYLSLIENVSYIQSTHPVSFYFSGLFFSCFSTMINIMASFFYKLHFKKYRYFTLFPGLEILWKLTVSAEFRMNCPKLCGNCAFPQNFHTRKLGKISVFYAVLW